MEAIRNGHSPVRPNWKGLLGGLKDYIRIKENLILRVWRIAIRDYRLSGAWE